MRSDSGPKMNNEMMDMRKFHRNLQRKKFDTKQLDHHLNRSGIIIRVEKSQLLPSNRTIFRSSINELRYNRSVVTTYLMFLSILHKFERTKQIYDLTFSE